MTFQEQLQETIAESLMGIYMKDEQGNFVPVDDKYSILTSFTVEAITTLIEKGIVGSDDKIKWLTIRGNQNGQEKYRYIKASDMPKYYQNKLRIEQRTKLRGEKE